jgi:hypothetical protein
VKDHKDAPRLVATITDLRLSRRSLLRGIAIGGAGLATAGFVACGDDDDSSIDPAAEGSTATTGEGGGESTGEVTSVKFVYGFPAPHAGILYTHYNAQEQGFWEEEGVKVEFNYQTAGIPLLAGGTVDFGEVSADELLNAYAAGQELKAFYQPTYGQQFGFVVPADSPITEWTAEQITGTTIGITELAGGEVPITRAALTRIGLTEGEDANFFPTSGDNQAVTVDAFNTGKIDIFAGSILDHAAVQVAGMELRAITPDFILNAAGDNAQGVRADYLEENRDLITRFGRGMAKAKVWSFAPANQDAAIDAALRVAPDTGSKEEVTSFIDILQISRALPAASAGIEEGEIWVQGWDDFQKLLLEGSTGSPDDPLTFSEPIDVNEIVDNSMVADIFDFDREELIARTAK